MTHFDIFLLNRSLSVKIKFSLAHFTYLTLVAEITPAASVDKLVIFVAVHIKSRRSGWNVSASPLAPCGPCIPRWPCKP